MTRYLIIRIRSFVERCERFRKTLVHFRDNFHLGVGIGNPKEKKNEFPKLDSAKIIFFDYRVCNTQSSCHEKCRALTFDNFYLLFLDRQTMKPIQV